MAQLHVAQIETLPCQDAKKMPRNPEIVESVGAEQAKPSTAPLHSLTIRLAGTVPNGKRLVVCISVPSSMKTSRHVLQRRLLKNYDISRLARLFFRKYANRPTLALVGGP